MPEKNQKELVASKAYDLHQQLLAAARDVQKAFVITGKCLYAMKKTKWYEHLEFQSFNEYLHDNQMPFAPTVGHALVKIYEQMVVRFKLKDDRLAQIGQAKAILLARFTEGREKVDIDDLLAEADTKPVHVLRQVLKEKSRGVSQEDCKHEDVEFVRCKLCYRVQYKIQQ